MIEKEPKTKQVVQQIEHMEKMDGGKNIMKKKKAE